MNNAPPIDLHRKLIEQFRDAAIRHSTATEDSRPDEANKAFVQLVKAAKHILKNSNVLLGALNELYASNEASVRLWAAVLGLTSDTDRAVRELKRISMESKNFTGLDAEMVLEELSLGRFKTPW